MLRHAYSFFMDMWKRWGRTTRKRRVEETCSAKKRLLFLVFSLSLHLSVLVCFFFSTPQQSVVKSRAYLCTHLPRSQIIVPALHTPPPSLAGLDVSQIKNHKKCTKLYILTARPTAAKAWSVTFCVALSKCCVFHAGDIETTAVPLDYRDNCILNCIHSFPQFFRENVTLKVTL